MSAIDTIVNHLGVYLTPDRMDHAIDAAGWFLAVVVLSVALARHLNKEITAGQLVTRRLRLTVAAVPILSGLAVGLLGWVCSGHAELVFWSVTGSVVHGVLAVRALAVLDAGVEEIKEEIEGDD